MGADSTDTPPPPADSPLSGTDTSLRQPDVGPVRDEGTPATDAAVPKPGHPAGSDSPGSAEMPDAHPTEAPWAPTRDEAHAMAVVDLRPVVDEGTASAGSLGMPRMSGPGSDDPPSNEVLPPRRLEGPTEVLGLESPYTMRSLFEEPTLSDFADHQSRSPDGLPTTGQDVAPPNAEFFAWPADSADADAWNELPEQVRESFRGEVRMEEFHDGIGRIVDPDSSIDGEYWYRDRDAAENEEAWRRDNAVLGQWNTGSSYVHLDGSEAPIKGWVGTTRGTGTKDGGWLPGGKEGIYIPRSEMFKLRDASVSGGKVPWRP